MSEVEVGRRSKGVRFWFVRLASPNGEIVERNQVNAAHLAAAARRVVAELNTEDIVRFGGGVGESMDLTYTGWAVDQNGQPTCAETRPVQVRLGSFLHERKASAA